MSANNLSRAAALALAACAGPASAQPQPQAPPVPAVAPANPATAATIAELAARARAAREAAAVPATVAPSLPLVPALGPGSAFPPGTAIPPVGREAGEPRLLSIAGKPGQERVELSFDGTIYSVSLRHPQLGSTGWRLTRVDVADAAVRIDNTALRPQRPASRRGAAPDAPSGYTIAFHRRDPDFGPPTQATPAAGPLPPAGLR